MNFKSWVLQSQLFSKAMKLCSCLATASAMSRPEQLHTYGNPKPDAADLAAAYAYGLARNNDFSDGNKRTAWVVARMFLADNGVNLQFSAVDAIQAMQAVAGGSLEEPQLADWFRQRIL